MDNCRTVWKDTCQGRWKEELWERNMEMFLISQRSFSRRLSIANVRKMTVGVS